MFDTYIYVPYGLFVLLVALAALGIEHAFVDLVRGAAKVMDWLEQHRRPRPTSSTPGAPGILSLEEWQREQQQQQQRSR